MKKYRGLPKAQIGNPLQGVTRKGNYLWEDNPDINAPYPSVKFSDSGVQLTPELGDMLMEEGSFSSMPGFDKFAARFNPANPIQKGRTSITPVTTSPPPKEKKEVWNPYMTLRGATTGLSWLANKADRNRQDQYMYNQMSTLGQMNPVNVNDYQPNPYNLYAQKGGSLKKYQQGGRTPIVVNNPNDPRLKAYKQQLQLNKDSANAVKIGEAEFAKFNANFNDYKKKKLNKETNETIKNDTEFAKIMLNTRYVPPEFISGQYDRNDDALNNIKRLVGIKPIEAAAYTYVQNDNHNNETISFIGTDYYRKFKKPQPVENIQPVVYQKPQPNGTNTKGQQLVKIQEQIKKGDTPKPIEPSLKRKVTNVQPIVNNNGESVQITPAPQNNVQLGNVPILPYRVEYDGTSHKNFLTAEDGEAFMQELQARPQGIPFGTRGYYEKKQNGGQFGLQNPRDIARSMIIPNTNNLAKEEAAMEINRRNKATDKRKFLNPTTTNTVLQEEQRLLKNKAYAATNPNVVMNQSGDLSRVNQDRDFQGNADNFMSQRQDKSYEHINNALLAAEGFGAAAIGIKALKPWMRNKLENLSQTMFKPKFNTIVSENGIGKVNPKTGNEYYKLDDAEMLSNDYEPHFTSDQYKKFLKNDKLSNDAKKWLDETGKIDPSDGGFSPRNNPTYNKMKDLLQYGKKPQLNKLDFTTSEELMNEKIFDIEFSKQMKNLSSSDLNIQSQIEEATKKALNNLRNNTDYSFDIGLKRSLKKLQRGPNTYNKWHKDFRPEFLNSQYPLGSQAKKTIRNPLGMIDDNFDISNKNINVFGDNALIDPKSVLRKEMINIRPEISNRDWKSKALDLYKSQLKQNLDNLNLENYSGKEAFKKLEPNKLGGLINSKKGGLTANKAREILHDKTAQGHPLTEKQRRFFGTMSKGHTNYRSK